MSILLWILAGLLYSFIGVISTYIGRRVFWDDWNSYCYEECRVLVTLCLGILWPIGNLAYWGIYKTIKFLFFSTNFGITRLYSSLDSFLENYEKNKELRKALKNRKILGYSKDKKNYQYPDLLTAAASYPIETQDRVVFRHWSNGSIETLTLNFNTLDEQKARELDFGLSKPIDLILNKNIEEYKESTKGTSLMRALAA